MVPPSPSQRAPAFTTVFTLKANRCRSGNLGHQSNALDDMQRSDDPTAELPYSKVFITVFIFSKVEGGAIMPCFPMLACPRSLRDGGVMWPGVGENGVHVKVGCTGL